MRADEEREFRAAAELEALGHLRELCLMWGIDPDVHAVAARDSPAMLRTLERYRAIWLAARQYKPARRERADVVEIETLPAPAEADEIDTVPPPAGWDPQDY